ncbi:MAG: crosslink repair DNA glycosylase YcaQ family protein, partial [Ilumatobacteraceae bacterium]
DEGPLVAGDLKTRVGKKGTWWDYDDGKRALEALFRDGRITATRRPNDFARVYDVRERVIPQRVLDTPAVDATEAHKELLVLAAKYLGVGTLKDLVDYHRLSLTRCKPLAAELVEDGRLVAADVEGWTQPAYLHPDARRPRRIAARALLSPFDPVVWNRDRALRMFDFHYRIEIYTPADKRRYGYYVLPLLLGDDLVGRVDLKADRANGSLLVQAAWAEPGVDRDHVADELMAELRLMATWLELDRIEIVGRGDLAPHLPATD